MKIYAAFFICTLTLSSTAQFGDELLLHYKQDVHSNHDNPIFTYGIEVEQFVTENISVNYNFNFGDYRTENKHHLHAPAGIIAGPPLFVMGAIGCIGCGNLDEDGYWEYEGTSGSWDFDSTWVSTADPDKVARCDRAGARLIGGLLLTFLPEGVNFHIPVVPDYVRLTPYVNLAGLDFIRDRELDETGLVWAYGGGARLVFSDPDNTINVSGYAEARGNNWTPLRGYYGLKLGFRMN